MDRHPEKMDKNQHIFVGFSEMLKKTMVKNWNLSKIALISFCGRMLKSKNLKMGTSSKAQFKLTCLFYCARGLKHHQSDRN